ncbi:MAG: hypothetical protein Q9222_004747 [Ikaeria aurantiellina]
MEGYKFLQKVQDLHELIMIRDDHIGDTERADELDQMITQDIRSLRSNITGKGSSILSELRLCRSTLKDLGFNLFDIDSLIHETLRVMRQGSGLPEMVRYSSPLGGQSLTLFKSSASSSWSVRVKKYTIDGRTHFSLPPRQPIDLVINSQDEYSFKILSVSKTRGMKVSCKFKKSEVRSAHHVSNPNGLQVFFQSQGSPEKVILITLTNDNDLSEVVKKYSSGKLLPDIKSEAQ